MMTTDLCILHNALRQISGVVAKEFNMRFTLIGAEGYSTHHRVYELESNSDDTTVLWVDPTHADCSTPLPETKSTSQFRAPSSSSDIIFDKIVYYVPE